MGVLLTDKLHLVSQSLNQPLRKRNGSVLFSFSITNGHLPPVEIDVLGN